jgi:hypothetical protein
VELTELESAIGSGRVPAESKVFLEKPGKACLIFNEFHIISFGRWCGLAWHKNTEVKICLT